MTKHRADHDWDLRHCPECRREAGSFLGLCALGLVTMLLWAIASL
jgi:hypothetical protein